jgi:hypothetical protein
LIDQNTSLEEGVFVNFFGVPASAKRALRSWPRDRCRRADPRLRLVVA